MIEENKIMNEIPIYTIIKIEAEEAEIPMLTFYVKEDAMDEIVFRAGSRFKVLNVYQEETRKYGFGKGWVVELEEI
jgi:hypothetical protein